MTSLQSHDIKDAKRLFWLERTVSILDDRFRIPGTKFRFGIDPLISIVPWLGDMVSFAISGMLVIVMIRHGASGMVVVKMIRNVLLDVTIGAIPILGDLFDTWFKANRRNYRLLKEHYEEGKHTGTARGAIIATLLFVLAVLVVMAILFVRFLMWLF